MNPGIYLLHKDVGVTSFSLVQSCRATEKRRNICHGGTLDPFASGLMLILVEPVTQLFDYLHAIPKVYEATVRWGEETDNGDPLGQVTSTGDAGALSPTALDEALATFLGWKEQTPPATSAKRIGGERAYIRVQRGETVNLPPSRVYLHEARWLDHDLPRQSRLRLTVRGGYYVRALARDLGRLLGCRAHLSQLARLSIGPWIDPGPQQTLEVHGSDVLPWAPSRVLSEYEVAQLRTKRSIALGEVLPGTWKLPPGFPDPEAPVRGFHKGRFRYLLKPEEGKLITLTALRGEL